MYSQAEFQLAMAWGGVCGGISLSAYYLCSVPPVVPPVLWELLYHNKQTASAFPK